MATKLHELLAVNRNMDGQVAKVASDLTATFTNKRHLFEEKLVTFTPTEEGKTPVTEARSDIQSTVAKELAWAFGTIAKGMDLGFQIDGANTIAKADVVTEDGDTLLKDVPATFLLQLEKRVLLVQGLISAIPTLDPAKGFQPDETRDKGIFKARDVTKNRTTKIEDYQVIVPPTKEFAAQVAKTSKDVVTGRIQEQEWSAMLTPATKSALLDRCDMLSRAIKKARARANETEVSTTGNKVGKILLDWLSQPLSA